MRFLFLILFLFFGNDLLAAGNCGPRAHWVRAYHRRAYTRYDGTFVSATNVRAHCQGNPPGYDYWNPKLQEGRPVDWPYPNEKSLKWTEEERERVIEALSTLPDVLWKNSNIQIFRMNKSTTTNNNSATYAPNTIVLYDSAFTSNKSLEQQLGHEFSHEQWDELSDSEQADYRDLNGWVSKKKGNTLVWQNIGHSFVEPDGNYSPSEDFANNAEYYLFKPWRLKDISPNAYGWIKEHYGDKLKVKGGK